MLPTSSSSSIWICTKSGRCNYSGLAVDALKWCVIQVLLLFLYMYRGSDVGVDAEEATVHQYAMNALALVAHQPSGQAVLLQASVSGGLGVLTHLPVTVLLGAKAFDHSR